MKPIFLFSSSVQLICSLSLCVQVLLHSPAFAQAPPAALSMRVPPLVYVKSGIETSLPIQIESGEAELERIWVLLRGIPSNITLSEGRLFPSGTWVIKASSVSNTLIMTPPNDEYEAQIEVALVTLGGKSLLKASTRFVVAPSAATQDAPIVSTALEGIDEPEADSAAPATSALSTSVEADEPPENVEVASVEEEPTDQAAPQSAITSKGDPLPLLSEEDKRRIDTLIERGNDNLRDGRINAARLFYTRAAEIGSADAALLLGRTYDPTQLGQLLILGGIESDLELARKWYKTAQELGSERAAARIQALSQR